MRGQNSMTHESEICMRGPSKETAHYWLNKRYRYHRDKVEGHLQDFVFQDWLKQNHEVCVSLSGYAGKLKEIMLLRLAGWLGLTQPNLSFEPKSPAFLAALVSNLPLKLEWWIIFWILAWGDRSWEVGWSLIGPPPKVGTTLGASPLWPEWTLSEIIQEHLSLRRAQKGCPNTRAARHSWESYPWSCIAI